MSHTDVPPSHDGSGLPASGLPPAGTMLMIGLADAPAATVLVERSIDDRVVAMVSDGRIPADGAATIRWFDPSRPIVEADALVARAEDPSRVELHLRSGWRAADGRRSQRLEARCSMPGHVLPTVENNLVPRLRLDLVCLDLSATGMRAAYHGRPPGLAELIEMEMGAPGVASRRIVARVTRVEAFPFGRSEIGLTFVFDSPEERQHVMALRNILPTGGSLPAGASAV